MEVFAKTVFGISMIMLSGFFSMQAAADVPQSAAAHRQSQALSSRNESSERIIAAQNATAAYNWAGYVADEGQYTGVSGTWEVPSVTDLTGNGADAAWVGIGGVDTNDLIQAGTEALPDDRGSSYSAWFEVLPDDSEIVPLRVRPGDSITISINEVAPTQWTIAFRNNTTGDAYQKSVTYASSRSSAEWIEEMPVSPDSPITLDDFGTVHFSNGYAIEGGAKQSIAETGATPLRMDNKAHQALAIPSELGSDGMSFAVMRTDASARPLSYNRVYDEY